MKSFLHPFNLSLFVLIVAALVVNQYWLAVTFAYGVVGFRLGRRGRRS